MQPSTSRVFLLIVSLTGLIHEIDFAAEDQNFAGSLTLSRCNNLDLKSGTGCCSELWNRVIVLELLHNFFHLSFENIEIACGDTISFDPDRIIINLQYVFLAIG